MISSMPTKYCGHGKNEKCCAYGGDEKCSVYCVAWVVGGRDAKSCVSTTITMIATITTITAIPPLPPIQKILRLSPFIMIGYQNFLDNKYRDSQKFARKPENLVVDW